MKKIHCPGPKARYCRQRIAAPSRFAARSLRTVKAKGGRKLVVGCPKGKFRKGRCSVGTRLQTILYPLGSKKCRAACR